MKVREELVLQTGGAAAIGVASKAQLELQKERDSETKQEKLLKRFQNRMSLALAAMLNPIGTMLRYDKDLQSEESKKRVSFARSVYTGKPSSVCQQWLISRAAEKRERRQQRNLRNRERMFPGSWPGK